MISKATVKYLRISPSKVRLILPLIKDRNAYEALSLLRVTNKRAAFLLVKLLNSAIANAKRLPNIRQEDLYISNVFADGGPSLKRYKAQAMGRANMILKRTSHITVELDIKAPLIQPKDVKPSAKPKRDRKNLMQKAKVAKPKDRKAKAARVTKKSVREGVKSGT